jgi:hypothetical protein
LRSIWTHAAGRCRSYGCRAIEDIAMTLTRLEDLQLQAALLAQQLAELPRSTSSEAKGLLERLVLTVGEAHGLAVASGPMVALRLRETERLMHEAATPTNDEPHWRASVQDLRAELEAQAFTERRSASGESAGL